MAGIQAKRMKKKRSVKQTPEDIDRYSQATQMEQQGSGRPPLSLYEEEIKRLGKAAGKTLAEMRSITLHNDQWAKWPRSAASTINNPFNEDDYYVTNI